MSVDPNVPVPSAKNETGDFERFKEFARRVVAVPHSQVKAQLEAEKAAKRISKIPVSRASASSSKKS
jgi:hypothetical protein